MLPRLTFVLGGASSGKSAYAEKLLSDSGLSPVYLATAQALDAEMEARIAEHVVRRDARWRTLEAPLEIADALAGLKSGDGVLVDCATLWLTNYMMAERPLATAGAALLEELRVAPVPVVVVSNEIGQGVVPMNAMARGFRDAMGKVNIMLAREADVVVHMVAGLPNVLKGPEG